MIPPLNDLVLAVTAVGLPGSLRELPRQQLPEHEAWDLIRAAEQQGLAGALLASIRSGALVLPSIVLREVVDAHAREVSTRSRLESELITVSALLDDARIGFRVLGGSAVARLDYQDSSLRTFAALDLLVEPADVDAVRMLLQRRGWSKVQPAGAPRAVGKGVVLARPSGERLQLHTAVDHAPGGRPVSATQLWSNGHEFGLGKQRLTALDTERRLLHACCDVVGAGPVPPPVLLRDIAEIVLFGHWDEARLMTLALEWNARATLAQAVMSAWQRLAIADVVGLSVWAQAYRPNRAERPPGRQGTAATTPGFALMSRAGLRLLARPR